MPALNFPPRRGRRRTSTRLPGRYLVEFTSRLCVLVMGAALLAVVVAFAIFGAGPSHAQGAERDYVDVALILETPESRIPDHRDLTVIVMNLGSRTAYDVEVVVDVVKPENSSLFDVLEDVPIGAASIENGGYSFRWTIPELGGLQRVEVTNYVVTDRDPVFNVEEYPHVFFGQVTTASFESGLRQGNNTDRVWSVMTNFHNSVVNAPHPHYSVNVSVDERNPSPGDVVNFTVTANNLTRAVIDQEVAIELTNGLAVDEDATATPPRVISYTPDDRVASVGYSNGVFNIGTLKYSDWKYTHSVTLPIRISSNAVVNEQCLTATMTGNPPPVAGPRDDDTSDNVAMLCLGEPPDEKLVFRDGTADLWALYPCVGVTASPCDDTDSVVLAINGLSAAVEAGVPYEVFIPDNVVVHIPDDVGRNVFGGELFWTNGHDADNSANGAGILPGVVAKFDRSLIGTDNYS